MLIPSPTYHGATKSTIQSQAEQNALVHHVVASLWQWSFLKDISVNLILRLCLILDVCSSSPCRDEVVMPLIKFAQLLFPTLFDQVHGFSVI